MMKNICFITKSDKFDQLITQFKKNGINAFKKDVNSSIKDSNVLIVDLGYPTDLSFPFLINIQNEKDYSDKIILAVISQKSQLSKLRSIALGCDGYISSTITYKDLIEKLKILEEPSKYVIKKSFNNKSTEITYNGTLTHISENGCLVNSKVSIDPEDIKVSIKSKLIKDLDLQEKIIFKPSKSNPVVRRSFLTEINFLNLNEEDRQKIRKLLINWRAV